MANFNAMFAGCESFMESDIETDDEGVYTSEGDALEAESVAEDVGTEGGEIAGEAETEDTKAEAANMVFDQLINMYIHVKRYGVDKTFLSLYNNDGQLNKMIGYRFPSCESIDSVGSPRSQASRAFIVAMEEDGIFKRIWTWIKDVITKVYNFFIRVIDWFREACGNLDIRVGKLWKYFSNSSPRRWSDIKDKTVKYIERKKFETYLNKNRQMQYASGGMFNVFTTKESGPIEKKLNGSLPIRESDNLTDTMANAAQAMSQRLEDISNQIKYESTRTKDYTYGNPKIIKPIHVNAYGSTKDRDDENGMQALKKYLDRINKDFVDPLADAVSDLTLESCELRDIDADKYITITLDYKNARRSGEIGVLMFAHKTSYKSISDDSHDAHIRTNTLKMLESCKGVLRFLLQQKQAMDMMNLANKQSKQLAEQTSRHSGDGSFGYEEQKEARLATVGIVKANSIFTRISNLNEKIIAKCCTLAASLQDCVKPDSYMPSKSNGGHRSRRFKQNKNKKKKSS